ncbi:hypothetical protein DVH24_024204 [Malus domestica]|uniref:Uncharacterized protein n=1 Tax=Malus domestica TaxID=3750 RepID=A0A498JG62_MALDO|nr:hypothetical protein DVH24_024204 [Malus domestica]
MKSHAFHVLQFLFILRGMNRKTNKKGLKTLSFNDKDKIKGKVKKLRLRGSYRFHGTGSQILRVPKIVFYLIKYLMK